MKKEHERLQALMQEQSALFEMRKTELHRLFDLMQTVNSTLKENPSISENRFFVDDQQQQGSDDENDSVVHE
jgi:hypothetical protein